MHNISHFFEIDENKFVLDHRNIFFCLLDNETEQGIKYALSCETDKLIPDAKNERDHVVNALIKSGLFLSNDNDDYVPNFKYDILNISFAPIHDCNFSCSYCYAEGGKSSRNYLNDFDESKIDKLLSYIYIDKYSEYKKYKFDFVSGGEPLLNFPILKYFLNRVRHLDNTLGKNTAILIVTNGTLLTNDIIKALDTCDVFLGISVDGPEQVHNQHRLYSNGGETYRDVVNGINILRSSEGSSKIKDAWAMSVITCKSGSLIDIMENCINLGFKRMQMQILRQSSDHPLAFKKTDLQHLKTHYKKLFSHILVHAEKGDLSRIKMIANDNDSFGKFLGRLLLRSPVYYRCFAGKNKISVAANGEIYPCDSFCGIDDFTLGSLDSPIGVTGRYSTVVDMFDQAHVHNRRRCSKCWAKFICGGDCYYNSYLKNGNIYDPDPIVCEMNQFFIEHAIDVLIKLQAIDKEYIAYLAKFLSLQHKR